jgi:hypothetical protein
VSKPGLEERYFGDGLLAIQVIPTYNAKNVITSLDEGNAKTSNIVQFLKDVLIGTNSLGSGGVSANTYVKKCGSDQETSYKNAISGLYRYLIKQDD